MKKLFLAVMVCLLPLFISACGEPPQMAEVGTPAPDFTLSDTSGRTWTLSELKGKVVFINFWATWCPPCREEMPSMQRVYDTLPRDKFEMLAIIYNDAPAMADIFAKKLGLTIPLLVDPNNMTGGKYGLTGVPETYIVDKQGILREKFIGPAEWDSPQVMQMLSRYVNQ